MIGSEEKLKLILDTLTPRYLCQLQRRHDRRFHRSVWPARLILSSIGKPRASRRSAENGLSAYCLSAVAADFFNAPAVTCQSQMGSLKEFPRRPIFMPKERVAGGFFHSPAKCDFVAASEGEQNKIRADQPTDAGSRPSSDQRVVDARIRSAQCSFSGRPAPQPRRLHRSRG